MPLRSCEREKERDARSSRRQSPAVGQRPMCVCQKKKVRGQRYAHTGAVLHDTKAQSLGRVMCAGLFTNVAVGLAAGWLHVARGSFARSLARSLDCLLPSAG